MILNLGVSLKWYNFMIRVVLGDGSPSKITLYILIKEKLYQVWCFYLLCLHILKIYNKATRLYVVYHHFYEIWATANFIDKLIC